MSKIIEDVNENGWAKAIVVNDWGHLGYFLKAVQSDFGTWGLAEQNPSWQLRAGEIVRVLWPDGSVSGARLRAEPVQHHVADHGHNYNTDTNKLYIALTVNGAEVKVPLDDLRFKKIES